MDSQKESPLTLQAYNILKEKIMLLQFRPGEILIVQALSKELGISRTPIREAVVRLEREGFVEATEGKKFKVSVLTMQKVLEIHEIRKLMEQHAVRNVAMTATKKQVSELNSTIKHMEKALSSKSYDNYFKYDLVFHDRIIQYHGNETLGQLMGQVNGKMQRIRYLTTLIGDRLEKTLIEHQDIINAIQEHNPEKAVDKMALHLEKVKDGLASFFEKHESTFMARMFINNN
ncbi:MAG: GntR family transcriptional regulator [Desulfobacteraceae bacterium]|jgi:DNA-binding GntR family transcriptional regulator|nr:GntR family transcriptional regulator [Desulfobacteraceae bacterium]